MEYENTTTGQGSAYAQLQELHHSDFEIKDGEPDITGWDVKNEQGRTIGKVDDLLFDPKEMKVRYIVLDTEGNDTDADKRRKVLIPIGVAQLHTKDDDVILPEITLGQLGRLSSYEGWAKMTAEVESADRLVLEPGETGPYSYPQFYDHSHFDEDKFYNRGNGSDNQFDPADDNTVAADESARKAEVRRIVERINKKESDS